MEPCVRIEAWAARPNADLGIYAYAYEASMRTHRSIPASINRGAFHHFKESQLPHLAYILAFHLAKIGKGAKKHVFGGRTGRLGAQASAQAPKREATETQT
ncbi:hypothetical protein PIB30_062862 [Stylosanthes scabra]|uniref:Uncharacterized protein n=1 Tax=Stylosanthes scabra TaxID=79078 RepID=A0ABU6QLY0_9FABA|nr:hypothetical protein [Stylosanthes scabra]